MERPSTRRRSCTTAKRRARFSSAPSVGPPDSKKRETLSARQTEACLATHTLFFPSASEEELPNQRIGIKDIQRLSKLIGDKLKGDEVRVVSSFLRRSALLLRSFILPQVFMIFLTYMDTQIIEMLSEFSTSPDKSMSFADFGDMMRAVKLV
jgi:hypothetical protein